MIVVRMSFLEGGSEYYRYSTISATILLSIQENFALHQLGSLLTSRLEMLFAIDLRG